MNKIKIDNNRTIMNTTRNSRTNHSADGVERTRNYKSTKLRITKIVSLFILSIVCVPIYGNMATVDPCATAANIIVTGTTEICHGANTTLTASSTGGIPDPVYRWYASQTATTPFNIGTSYTTSNLTADSTFYVSVSGTGWCENATGDRKEVTVIILDPNTQGQDFYVSFGSYLQRAISNITMQIRIVAQKATTVDLTYNNNTTLNKTLTIPAGSVYTHDLTTDEKTAVYSSATGTSNKSLRIQSTEPISVYALNRSPNTTDATFVLPVDVLGTDYYHISYMPIFTTDEPTLSDGYTIVAIDDDTKIYENDSSTPKTTLQSGQVYSYYTTADMTGYHITSSKPVAYFVTNQLTTVPHSIQARDHLYEQMTPVNVWGKTFVVPVTIRGVERVRIVASQDGTVITQSGGVINSVTGGQTSLNLNRGQFVELEIKLVTGGCYISSNKPIGVASYLVGMTYSEVTYKQGTVGDPSLTIVPPVEQMIISADIAPFIPSGDTNLSEHYVMVITPKATRNQTTVTIGNSSATTLSGGSWTDGNGLGADYSFYTMPLTNATDAYHFTNPNGLLVMGFGFGEMESYCYLSGAAVRTLEASFYVDNNHYLDLDGQSICVDNQVEFRSSSITTETGATDYLKWFIDGVEETARRDVLQWTRSLANGSHTVRIDVIEKCKTYSFETTFTVTNKATANDITTKDTTVCFGTTETLKVSSSFPSPTFLWYKSQTASTPFHTGATYTTSALTADTVLYVSVAGTGSCENVPGYKEAITVTVDSICAKDDYITVSCDDMPVTIDVLTNDNKHCSSPAITVGIIQQPKHGTASVSNNKISYTSNLSGIDTIIYSVTCGTNYDEAKVCLTVEASVSAFVDDVWYFGYNSSAGGKSPGIRFVKDGSGNYVPQDASGESNVNTGENSLVVSSPYCDGQNIFYSSHNQLYNSLHEPMQNGVFQGNSSVADGLAACYMGNNRYLFFSVTAAYGEPKRLIAYVVDMNAQNGRGERISSMDIEVEPAHTSMSETVELIAKAGTTNQYWLIYAHCNGSCDGYNSNELRVRLVDVSDPDNPQIASSYTRYAKSLSYTFTMKTARQYNRIAIAHGGGIVDIFDFNNSTGVLSNPLTISGLTGATYGVEFSPNGKQLYCAPWQYDILYQYDISADIVGLKNSVSRGSSGGGGLKLGPDGNIYVIKSSTNVIGIISNPDNPPASLSSRYNGSAMTLGVTYAGLQLPTGLTKPAVMSCNMNVPPTAQDDSTSLCVSSISRTTTVNVLRNDDDAANNTIYLTNAEFIHPADADLADITVNASDSTITLTVKNDANISAVHVFEIIYDIKDNGLPASQCATGILKVTAIPAATAADITSKDTTVCYGATATLKVSSSRPSPTFRWYISQTTPTSFHTGSTYTTSALTAGATFYVGVVGTGTDYCENATNDRRAITVTVDSICARDDHTSTISTTPVKIDVYANDIVADNCTPTLTILTPTTTRGGTATVVNDSVQYFAAAGFFGLDTITYTVACNTNTDVAKIYVLVSKPLSPQYVACPDAPVTIGFTAISGVTYHWFTVPTAGSATSSSNTLQTTKDATSIQTWWVEPRAGQLIFPRHRVDLELSDNCGTTVPQGCAATGTVIFKEDYGGNDVLLPERSSTPLGAGIVDYIFCDAGSGTSIQGEGYYAITKKSIAHTSPIWHGGYSDHTYPNDITKGYMFLANAGQTAGKFYEYRIDNLCANTDLYFSAWLANLCRADYAGPQEPYLKFELMDLSNNVIGVYYTGKLPRTSQSAGIVWLQYGFKFNNVRNSSVIMRIYNDGNGGSGNDFVMDDIEIRLCAPPVTVNIVGNDTVVCANNNLDIISTYEVDCTFGDDLAYLWEFRHADSVNWKPLTLKNVTIACAAANLADRTITDTVSIASASKAHEGYYRMSVSSPTYIGSINCRAASDSVYVHVVEPYIAPDIRIQICPSPPNHTVQLSKYLDSTDYDRIKWEQMSPYPIIANPEIGLIQNANLRKNGTYTFKYTLQSPEHSGCGKSAAKVYMRVLNNRMFGRSVDTITICSALVTSRSINLNQIFGLELGGVLSHLNDPDNVVTNNVKKFAISSKYAGAMVFNAQKAYAEAGNSYDVSYKGISCKAFDFVYTTSSPCVNVTKRVVLVVTP
jgi:hypothetical protein